MKSFRWFLFVILMLSAAAGGWYLYQKGTHEMREFRVPGHLASIYVKVSEKYGVPWYVLAAVDEVENSYRKVNRKTIERNAIKIKNVRNGSFAENEEIERVLHQIYTPEKANQMMEIIQAYEWEVAPLAKILCRSVSQTRQRKDTLCRQLGSG